MQFRLKAFGLHLLGSATALTLILGGLYLGWYSWPGWYLTGVMHVLVIVGIVDLALGPTLTLIVANPRKPRRELARDIGIIVTVQMAALAYGTATLWQGRPLYYAFSVNSLDMVQASDIQKPEVAFALAVAMAGRAFTRVPPFRTVATQVVYSLDASTGCFSITVSAWLGSAPLAAATAVMAFAISGSSTLARSRKKARVTGSKRSFGRYFPSFSSAAANR